ncbi:glycosyltransferase [Sneathiella aquimaris]|uniref:glycosyltransferase n=1 Tax=Sneathiella aquimaris TaxID=2599305 RepID=UPI00146D5B9A|nr:glycosyltransferase [Sneathiella aquimaris]
MGEGVKKKLLIIAYFFPPIGGAGAQRPTKFAKYLAKDGWDVTVLTKEQIDEGNRWEPKDLSLFDDVDDKTGQISVIRIPEKGKTTGQFAIDPFENWALSAGKYTLDLLDKDHFDAVFITMSPFSLTIAADEIRKRSSVPVILDLRDPWILDGWTPQKTYLHWQLNYRKMSHALVHASGVVANTEEAGKLFLENFEQLDEKQLCVIENGFDEEDFTRPLETPEDRAPKKTFTLMFSGSLCTQPKMNWSSPKDILKHLLRYSPEKIDPSGRTLIHLLKAVEILESRNEPLAKILKIECLGLATEMDRESVEASRVGNIVTFCGYIPHDQAVKKIRSADGLFLPLHGAASLSRSRIVPGKTYEYMATGLPILGCLPEGNARELIGKYEGGFVANPLNPEEIADQLLKMWQFSGSEKPAPEANSWIYTYERKNLTKKLAVFLEKIIQANSK